MKLSDTTESYRQALALALQERSELLAALKAMVKDYEGSLHIDGDDAAFLAAEAVIKKVDGVK
jgi:hypothetical protein